MYAASGSMIDGWGWIWQMGPVWTLLVLIVVGLVVLGLVTTTGSPRTATAPDAEE